MIRSSTRNAFRAAGQLLETVTPNTTLARLATRDGVPACSEFLRVDRLPRRTWSADDRMYAVKHMTEALRVRRGEQQLWADQAVALVEAHASRGLVGGIRVSGGKSLVSLAVGTLFDVPRPLLIVPSKSIKTKKIANAAADAAKHWRIRSDISWIAYEQLQRKAYADFLSRYKPGIVIMDEAHHAGRYDSSRSSRIDRYVEEYGVPIIVLTGSLIGSHVVNDSCKLCYWALGDGSPLPRPGASATIRWWAHALEQPAKIEPGALRRWARPKESTLSGVGRRYVETPGIVTSSGESVIGTSLTLQTEYVELKSKAVLKAFEHLRAGRQPDGTELLDADGSNIWLQGQTLALGFYYMPDPKPPADYIDAKRNWYSYAREVIRQGELDTELQVREATDPEECWPLQEWLEVKGTFVERRKAVWLSWERVEAAQKWMAQHKHGIVWCQFAAFGAALKPYYGAGALDAASGRRITEHAKGSACAASIKVCSEDLNLQHQFSEALFIAPPATGTWHEQAIARFHRYGQPEPETRVTYWLACSENAAALDVARRREREAAALIKDKYRKLLIGEWFHDQNKPKKSPAWRDVHLRESVMI